MGCHGEKQRRRVYVRLWCGGGLVLGLGTGMVGLRNIAPAPVTISLANALICFGLLIGWQSLPGAALAIQLVIFLTNRLVPIASYPAQLASVFGVTMVFLAVISNFAFLGILLERKASQNAQEIKRAEREAVLREFSARLSRLDRLRSLGALTGALAHELTQPLTAILSNAELAEASLKKGGQNAEEQGEQHADLVQGIVRNARRGKAIVQRIRQRLQPVDPVLGKVDLFWLSSDVIDLMAPLLQVHQVVLARRMPDTPLVVSGDSIELSQVLVIVLTNAIEACSSTATATASSRRIEIALQADGGRATIWRRWILLCRHSQVPAACCAICGCRRWTAWLCSANCKGAMCPRWC